MPGKLPIPMTSGGPVKFHYRYHSSHLLWLFLLLLSFILQASGQVQAWRFDRALIEQGDVWLMLSGHIVHFNWPHWLLNMAGLAIVAFFFSPHASVRQWLAVILVSASLISIAILLWLPEIRTYVGLSGVLHGLFLYGALREIRYYPLSGYVLFAVLVIKLCWESLYGALPGSEEMTGGRVLTESHLFGAIGGVLVWSFEYIKDRLGRLVK